MDAARQNITMTLLDGKRKPVKRFHFMKAWPSAWKGPSLEAGNSGPAVEQVTITYEDSKVENI
ncbi:phage tail protein [Nocardia sp. NPDC059091]|uniref:phage tail protein n=1 Tax=unclassified Nocardia TaxID=2637762 RepID=UPI00369EC3E3